MAHTAGGSLRAGIDAKKLDAVWEYKTSPLYNARERVALDFALAAGAQPNAVSDELFAELKKHWSDGEIVEITAVVALFGFYNRYNDTMATPLEAEPIEVGEKYLASHGWHVGRHRR
jgi:alkylhydroperoxidase family enzyme